jgi:hypothetical protein
MRRIALGLLTLSLLVAASSACFARGGGGHGHGHGHGHSAASPVPHHWQSQVSAAFLRPDMYGVPTSRCGKPTPG